MSDDSDSDSDLDPDFDSEPGTIVSDSDFQPPPQSDTDKDSATEEDYINQDPVFICSRHIISGDSKECDTYFHELQPFKNEEL